ncbi:ATP-dependent helicase, partial [Streptomyces fulvissimus]|nr:ATP-dependent helicase [Streptomyces microflavus]
AAVKPVAEPVAQVPAAAAPVEAGFQTVAVAAGIAEPVATRPRRRTRIVKPADEVDFQIAPASEPEPDAKSRRRPARTTSRPKAESKPKAETAPKADAGTKAESTPKAESKPKRASRAKAAAPVEAVAPESPAAVEAETEAKPRRRRATRSVTSTAVQEAAVVSEAEAVVS